MGLSDQAARQRVEQVERLLDQVEAWEDAQARATAADTVQALLDLYGEGLARVVAHAERLGAGALVEALTGDELIAHLLLLHGVHPTPLETRVTQALDEVRPYLRSHGGNVELLGIVGGVARLRLQGSCSGCPSSTMTLKLAIEDAIYKAAPDLLAIEAEGAAPAHAGPLLQIAPEPPGDPTGESGAWPGDWVVVGPAAQFTGLRVREVGGGSALFVPLDHDLYAYRPACPACGASLGDGRLDGADLACPGCEHRYDLRRAGRCLDAPQLHLDPIPLLISAQGIVKVAVVGEGAPPKALG